MTTVYYTSFEQKLSDEKFQSYLKELPETFVNAIVRYKRWEDAHASLLGKLLLKKALADYSDSFTLKDIQVNKYNRPFLNDNIDFNISHSGKYVLCAISDKTKVGIDIEKILPIDYASFKNVFNPKELDEIKNDTEPLRKFYEYWTNKEAAIKGDGRGMSILLKKVEIFKEIVKIENRDWLTMPIFIDKDFIVTLAFKEDYPVSIKYIDF